MVGAFAMAGETRFAPAARPRQGVAFVRITLLLEQFFGHRRKPILHQVPTPAPAINVMAAIVDVAVMFERQSTPHVGKNARKLGSAANTCGTGGW